MNRRQWIDSVARSRGRGCVDVPWPATRYPKVKVDGRWVQASHLVLEASGRPRPNLDAEALHSCDRPTCVAPWHLRWGTHGENVAEAVERGRMAAGEHSGAARLTVEQVEAIRSSSEPLRTLAARFGVGHVTVWAVRQGRSWVRQGSPSHR